MQMAKNDLEEHRKSSLSDCTWLENVYGSFNLETLKFLMHFREPGSSVYFIFTHTHIFSLFLIHIYFSFSSFFFLSYHFFICSPFEL
jgi:hypothetical protein